MQFPGADANFKVKAKSAIMQRVLLYDIKYDDPIMITGNARRSAHRAPATAALGQSLHFEEHGVGTSRYAPNDINKFSHTMYSIQHIQETQPAQAHDIR